MVLLGILHGEIAGIVSFDRSDRERISRYGQLGISVQMKHWGIGVGTALLSEIIHTALHKTDLGAITLCVNAENLRAIRLYERFGFQRIGVHKDYFNIRGRFSDEVMMDLLLQRD